MENKAIISEHYKNIAKNYGAKKNSTIADPVIREVELLFFQLQLTEITEASQMKLRVMEIGCGNGALLSHLKKNFPQHRYTGIDVCDDLLSIARERNLEGVSFYNADCSDNWKVAGQFDVVISNRVVINILDRKKQLEAFLKIKDGLKPEGHYLMAESFRNPLFNLNRARKEMRLPPLEESFQNKYLTDLSILKLLKLGFQEIDGALKSNYLSTHFYSTRVLHEVARPKGGKHKFSEFVKFVDEGFGPGVGDYSPILLRAFQRQ